MQSIRDGKQTLIEPLAILLVHVLGDVSGLTQSVSLEVLTEILQLKFLGDEDEDKDDMKKKAEELKEILRLKFLGDEDEDKDAVKRRRRRRVINLYQRRRRRRRRRRKRTTRGLDSMRMSVDFSAGHFSSSFLRCLGGDVKDKQTTLQIKYIQYDKLHFIYTSPMTWSVTPSWALVEVLFSASRVL